MSHSDASQHYVPFSQACENNKAPILALLQPLMNDRQRVLEIGSGTGQHAVYFAAKMPHIQWLCSDLAENHAGIKAQIAQAALRNVAMPFELDVRHTGWLNEDCDVVYTANTLHIMSWGAAQLAIQGAASCLTAGGLLVIYGPFNYHGDYSSPSNARFDIWLKQQNPQSAIRDFEALRDCAAAAGLQLQADHAMPANNRLLVFRRD